MCKTLALPRSSTLTLWVLNPSMFDGTSWLQVKIRCSTAKKRLLHLHLHLFAVQIRLYTTKRLIFTSKKDISCFQHQRFVKEKKRMHFSACGRVWSRVRLRRMGGFQKEGTSFIHCLRSIAGVGRTSLRGRRISTTPRSPVRRWTPASHRPLPIRLRARPRRLASAFPPAVLPRLRGSTSLPPTDPGPTPARASA